MSGALDYETSRNYLLTVQATDHGEPALSGTTIVIINVTDSNDNAPEFTKSRYVDVVKEDSEKGHEVLQVKSGEC